MKMPMETPWPIARCEACRCWRRRLANLTMWLGYRQAADRLQAAYFDAFYNPDTGVFGGWRSADGQLHDYYFLFVNGIAICYELVPADKAHAIMDRLLAKMREVGYTRFDLGLPGNLVVIPRRDYVHLDPRWGGGEREDNLDGFQRYENGGASACFVYFTVAALYKLDRHDRGRSDPVSHPGVRLSKVDSAVAHPTG